MKRRTAATRRDPSRGGEAVASDAACGESDPGRDAGARSDAGRVRGAGPDRYSGRRRLRGDSGQSTLETVAVLPLMMAVALAVGHVLAAGLTHELAGHAAQAGAIAVIRGGDARASAVAALPEWAEDEVSVRVIGRRVRVRLEPPAVIPGAADLLASTEVADAGPAPAATARVIGRMLELPRR